MYYKRSTGGIHVWKSAVVPSWVKWVHHSEGKSHCDECLRLDGCYFTEATHPTWPHHPFCHCTLDPIGYGIVLANASAVSAYGKFDPFLFNTNGKYDHGKEKLFKTWGYTADDATWLKAEWERQALEKYLGGDYVLNRLDNEGQRINIKIEIVRRDTGEVVTFVSGWMVYPNGKLQLATPFRR